MSTLIRVAANVAVAALLAWGIYEMRPVASTWSAEEYWLVALILWSFVTFYILKWSDQR
jgi:hypothetical protein